jgi:hypothetical protein
MKKLILIIGLIFATGAFALDVSVSEGNSFKNDDDRAIQQKDAEELRDGKSKRKSYTESIEKSKRTDYAIVKIEQTDILQALEELERKDVEDYKKRRTKELGFFGSCSIISSPRLPADFGITAEDGDIIDTNLATLIDNYAKASVPIKKIVSSSKERELKEYMNCLLKYGVIGAQSLTDGKFTLDITDSSILRLNSSGERSLKRDSDCRFNKSYDSIQCGSLRINLDYEPSLADNQISYYSSDRYLGLSGTETYTLSDAEAKRDEDSKSTERTISTSSSKDKTLMYKQTSSQNSDTKTEISARNVFQKLFK